MAVERITREKQKFIMLAIITVLCTIAFIMKIFIAEDISITDESFMYAGALRFLRGDAILVDGWDPWQLYGVVLFPFVGIYHFFVGSYSGLYLFMRFIFIILKLAVLIYGLGKSKHLNLNQHNVILGLFLSYFFVSWNFEALTYQQLPLILGTFIFIGALSDNTSILEYTLMGMAYAETILAVPFLIISYPLLLVCFGYKLFKNEFKKNSFVFFHIGIFVVFIPFMILLLSHASIREIIEGIPYVFSDPAHNVANSGIFGLIQRNIIIVFKVFIEENKFTTAINVLVLLVFHVATIGNWKHRKNLCILIPIALVVSIISMIPAKKMFFMNELYITFIWASIESLFFIRNQRYYLSLIAGYILVISVALGTNTGKYTTSGALNIIAVMLMFFSTETLEKDAKNKMMDKIYRICTATGFFAIVITALFLRIYMTWWGKPLSADCFKNKIAVGPMKGLYADDSEYNHYMSIYKDIKSIDFGDNDVLFCGTSTPMAYLIADVDVGSGNLQFTQMFYDRVELYWELHPDKIPSVIYYEKYTSADAESFLDEIINREFDIRTEGSRLIALRKTK